MGFIFSKSMNENLKSQQEFMLMNSRLQVIIYCNSGNKFSHPFVKAAENPVAPYRLTDVLEHELSWLERQLLMQSQMRERQMAMQIAWTREFLNYFGVFFGLAAVGLTAGAIKNKKPGLFLPMVPLSFVLAYHYDMGYGTLLQRMKGEAENILDTENTLLEMPKGALTFESLEKARRAQSKFFIEK